MNIEIQKNHPFYLFRKVLDAHPEIEKVELAHYHYHKQSLFDERRILTVPARDLTQAKLRIFLEHLSVGKELAVQSRVYTRKQEIFHIPMIDFHGEVNTDILKTLKNYIHHDIYQKMHFFLSGRSYHAYSEKLLNQEEWKQFMYSLLLINSPGQTDIIDTRWVAHRLLAGYGALRWSWNTKQYKQAPWEYSIENHNIGHIEKSETTFQEARQEILGL